MSIKKDGTIRDKNSRIFESYLKLRERKKCIKDKINKIQDDLNNNDCYISENDESDCSE